MLSEVALPTVKWSCTLNPSTSSAASARDAVDCRDTNAAASAPTSLLGKAAKPSSESDTQLHIDSPHLVEVAGYYAAMLDMTNPNARQWMKDVIIEEMISIGSSGWMADFGEAMPCEGAPSSLA